MPGIEMPSMLGLGSGVELGLELTNERLGLIRLQCCVAVVSMNGKRGTITQPDRHVVGSHASGVVWLQASSRRWDLMLISL
jgi:hypothetical protein